MAKKLYVSATNRSAGKTPVVLGLMLAFEKLAQNLGFIKPVGKRDKEAGGVGLDEDALLIEKICRVHCTLQDMSPVTIDREFDESFFRAAARQPLMPFILEAFARVAKDKDAVLIEGTSHAGMGAALGLSDAEVAKALDSKVLIVGSGGIVQAIEEIALNAAHFRAAGVEVAGAVVNRARPEDRAVLLGWGREALERLGVRLLGVIETKPIFESKTVLQVFEGLTGQLLNGDSRLGTRVGSTLIGALTTHNAIDNFEDDALLVTGGDRTDLIVAAVASKLMTKEGRGLSGLILTRGLRPPDAIMKLLKRTDLPVTLVRANTYDTATRVLGLEPKIAPSDKAKIDLARATVEESIDVGALYAGLQVHSIRPLEAILRIAVNGAAGRMGRRVIALAAEDARLEIVAALVRPGDPRAGEDAGTLSQTGRALGIPLSSELPEGARIDAAIDFSSPAASARFVRICADRRLPVVVATTGLDAAARSEIEAASKLVAVLVASNLSVGVALLARLVREAARALGLEADVEIVEFHHRQKRDAPSGTALSLARAVAEARGQRFEDAVVTARAGLSAEDRPRGEIAVHAARLCDVIGDHTVSFGFGSERVEVSHRAHSRDVFALGALRAARFVATAPPGLHGPEDALGLPA